MECSSIGINCGFDLQLSKEELVPFYHKTMEEAMNIALLALGEQPQDASTTHANIEDKNVLFLQDLLTSRISRLLWKNRLSWPEIELQEKFTSCSDTAFKIYNYILETVVVAYTVQIQHTENNQGKHDQKLLQQVLPKEMNILTDEKLKILSFSIDWKQKEAKPLEDHTKRVFECLINYVKMENGLGDPFKQVIGDIVAYFLSLTLPHLRDFPLKKETVIIQV